MLGWVPIAGLALLVAAPAIADDDDDLEWDRDGFYFNVGFNAAADFGRFEDLTGSDADESYGLSARAGYRWLEYLGTDLQFEWQEGFDLDGGAFDGREYEVWFVGIHQKAFLPLGRFQPFVSAGMGLLQTSRSGGGLPKDNDGGFAGRFGAGIDVYATKKLAITLDGTYTLPTGRVHDLEHFSFGAALTYRYDASY